MEVAGVGRFFLSITFQQWAYLKILQQKDILSICLVSE